MFHFTFPALFVVSFGVLSGFRKDALLQQTDVMVASRRHPSVHAVYIWWFCGTLSLQSAVLIVTNQSKGFVLDAFTIKHDISVSPGIYV